MDRLLTHAELVGLLGEIEGISLESEFHAAPHEGLQDVVVYLELGTERIELIRALRSGDGIISHHITRFGIREQLLAIGAKCMVSPDGR